MPWLKPIFLHLNPTKNAKVIISYPRHERYCLYALSNVQNGKDQKR